MFSICICQKICSTLHTSVDLSQCETNLLIIAELYMNYCEKLILIRYFNCFIQLKQLKFYNDKKKCFITTCYKLAFLNMLIFKWEIHTTLFWVFCLKEHALFWRVADYIPKHVRLNITYIWADNDNISSMNFSQRTKVKFT